MVEKPKTVEEKKQQFIEGLKKIVTAKEQLGMTNDITYIKAKETLDKLTKEEYNK